MSHVILLKDWKLRVYNCWIVQEGPGCCWHWELVTAPYANNADTHNNAYDVYTDIKSAANNFVKFLSLFFTGVTIDGKLLYYYYYLFIIYYSLFIYYLLFQFYVN